MRSLLRRRHQPTGAAAFLVTGNAILMMLLLVCVLPSALGADPKWTGKWDTRWRGGGAELVLTQVGDKVTGSYPLYGGRIEAQAAGSALRGRWIEGQRSGGFLFVMAPDGRSFMGRYDNGEWWTGGRISNDAPVTKLDQSSPRDTFRTFVYAGNLWRDGRIDEIGTATAVLDLGKHADAMLPGDKLDVAQRLFQAIDQTTFRIWTLRGREETRTVVPLTLHQASTTATLEIELRRGGDGRWWIVAPDKTRLDEAMADLLARNNGRPPAADDYLRLGSPRDTMRTFMGAFADWEGVGRHQAISALDLSAFAAGVREREGELAAEYLKKVLDRISVFVPQEIPDDPESRQPYVLFEHPAGNIVIGPAGEGKDTRWRFTADTVRTLRDVYAALEQMPAAQAGAARAPEFAFFTLRDRIRAAYPALLHRRGSMENWQTLGLLAAAAIGSALSFPLAGLVMILLHHGSRLSGVAADRDRLIWPLRIAFTCALVFVGSRVLGLPDVVQQIVQGVIAVGLAASLVWAGWWLVDVVGGARLRSTARTATTLDDILVTLVMFVVKLALLVAGSLYVADLLSIPYTGVLASLGVGGLALAIASQDTLANLFGAGILLVDRPFRRGDSIIVGDIQGSVEQVGIRSTRIRTAEDSILVVPNGKLADATINNLGTRRHRLMKTTLVVDYRTAPDRLTELTVGLRDLLAENPKTVHDRTYVGIDALGEHGIEVGLACYLDTQSATEERMAKQELLLGILRIVERLGIRLGPHSRAVLTDAARGDNAGVDPGVARVDQGLAVHRRDVVDLVDPGSP
jgi:small-conductance mechanosensitive channel